MPTGYTADVKDGKITFLKDYALTCARAFGALITMRDDPHDAPIPERFEPRTEYYDELIRESQAIISSLQNLSPDECERRSIAEHANALDSHRRYLSDKEIARTRYEAMRKQIKAWEVPTELKELRTFMLTQLTISIEHDCSTHFASDELKKLSGEAWRNSTLVKAASDLVYAIEHKNDEIRRTEDRNRWLELLRVSLP